MARKDKKAFSGIYTGLDETDGNVVLFSAKGEPSVIFGMTNPVQQLCTDSEQYVRFHDVLANIMQTLGEGYALQKQDILCRQSYHHDVPEDAAFLTRSYFRYFEGREFTEITTMLIITQEAQGGQFVQYDPKKWQEFHSKVSKVDDILTDRQIAHRKLTKAEVDEYCHRFMAFHFKFHPVAALHLKSHIVRCKCASVVSVRTGHISGIGTAGMRNIGALCYHCCRNGKPRRVVVFVPCAEI